MKISDLTLQYKAYKNNLTYYINLIKVDLTLKYKSYKTK